MRAWLRKPFNSELPYWLAVLVLGVIAIVPSGILFSLAMRIAELFHADTAALLPTYRFRELWIAVLLLVFGLPLIETALLALGLRLLGLLGLSVSVKSSISAVGWGLVHAITAPLQFFGVVWSFYVFSRGYLAWRPKSRGQAIGAAWIPHVMQNALAVGLSLFFSS